MKPFYLGRRWISNQRKSNSVWYNTPHWKITELILLCTEITESHLVNNHICQHRAMKTSTVTPSFYHAFNISLYCNDTIENPSEIYGKVLLLGNHLKGIKYWDLIFVIIIHSPNPLLTFDPSLSENGDLSLSPPAQFAGPYFNMWTNLQESFAVD